MRRVLLDENLPDRLRHLITLHDVRTTRYMGWSGLDNGHLIAAAESNGFDVMLTADQAMPHQQSLSGRHLAVIVLNDKTLPVLRRNLAVDYPGHRHRTARNLHDADLAPTADPATTTLCLLRKLTSSIQPPPS